MPWSVVVGYHHFRGPRDGGSKVLQNSGILSQLYMVSQPQRPQSEVTAMNEKKNFSPHMNQVKLLLYTWCFRSFMLCDQFILQTHTSVPSIMQSSSMMEWKTDTQDFAGSRSHKCIP
jgi:hypothetical protein